MYFYIRFLYYILLIYGLSSGLFSLQGYKGHRLMKMSKEQREDESKWRSMTPQVGILTQYHYVKYKQ